MFDDRIRDIVRLADVVISSRMIRLFNKGGLEWQFSAQGVSFLAETQSECLKERYQQPVNSRRQLADCDWLRGLAARFQRPYPGRDIRDWILVRDTDNWISGDSGVSGERDCLWLCGIF